MTYSRRSLSPRRLLIAPLAALALLVVPAGAQAACADADLAITSGSDPAAVAKATAAAVCLTNQERSRYGLPALAADGRLRTAAQRHSDDMVARDYFAHTSPAPNPREFAERISATGYQWGAASENIAGGQTTARQVVDGWLRSTGHCQNLLSPDPTEIGIGLKPLPASKNNGFGGYWTQKFARPVTVPAPSSDSGPRDRCPRTLGPDQAGPGDAGDRPAGATPPQDPGGEGPGDDQEPAESTPVTIREAGPVDVRARRFGDAIAVGGAIDPTESEPEAEASSLFAALQGDDEDGDRDEDQDGDRDEDRDEDQQEESYEEQEERVLAPHEVRVTVTRFGRSRSETVISAAGGSFAGELRPPGRPRGRRGRGSSRRIVVTVRVGERADEVRRDLRGIVGELG